MKSNDKITVRRAIPSDLKGIADLVLNSFLKEIHDGVKELESTDDPKESLTISKQKFIFDYMNRYKTKVPFVIYIAVKNGELIGASGGLVGEGKWAQSTWGCEDFWFVKKEHRGTRAGLLLFNKLMDWFKKMKVDRINMTHYTWNPKVEKFYDKKGFVPYEINYVYKVEKEYRDGTRSS